MQHSDDDIPTPQNATLLRRVLLPVLLLVLIGVCAGIVWQVVHEREGGRTPGSTVTRP